MLQLMINNLSVGYDGRAIIKDLSFDINKGDYIVIAGENGAGKTTLLRTLLSLHGIIAGEILFGDGFYPTDIGYLPQQRDVQKDFPASAFEVVLSGFLNKCGLRPFYNKREKAEAKENMLRTGVLDLARRCYRELSGGQQQRVLLARALCASGKMLLLDEPVSSLDPDAARGMYELIARLNKEDGITVVTVSHDIEAAMKNCTHALRLERGGAWSFFSKEDVPDA